MSDDAQQVQPIRSGGSWTVLEDLAEDVKAAVSRYAGTVPLAAAVGVLEIIKQELIEEHKR